MRRERELNMVAELVRGEKVFYKCEECDFTYNSKELSQSCEAWCKEHSSCNLEITRKAIILDDEKPVEKA